MDGKRLIRFVGAAFSTLLVLNCSSPTASTASLKDVTISISSYYDTLRAQAGTFDLAAYRKQSTWDGYLKALTTATNARVSIGPYSWSNGLRLLQSQKSQFTAFAKEYPTNGDYLDKNNLVVHPDQLTQAGIENALKDIQESIHAASLALDSLALGSFEDNQGCKRKDIDRSRFVGCLDKNTATSMLNERAIPPISDATRSCMAQRVQGYTVIDCDKLVPLQTPSPVLPTTTYNCGTGATSQGSCVNSGSSNGDIGIVVYGQNATP